jgi:MATH domain
MMYPKGNNSLRALSLYLSVYDPDKLPSGWHRQVDFVMTLADHGKRRGKKSSRVVRKVNGRTLASVTTTWGWSQFCDFVVLRGNQSGLLTGDKVVVEVKIVVISQLPVPFFDLDGVFDALQFDKETIDGIDVESMRVAYAASSQLNLAPIDSAFKVFIAAIVKEKRALDGEGNVDVQEMTKARVKEWRALTSKLRPVAKGSSCSLQRMETLWHDAIAMVLWAKNVSSEKGSPVDANEAIVLSDGDDDDDKGKQIVATSTSGTSSSFSSSSSSSSSLLLLKAQMVHEGDAMRAQCFDAIVPLEEQLRKAVASIDTSVADLECGRTALLPLLTNSDEALATITLPMVRREQLSSAVSAEVDAKIAALKDTAAMMSGALDWLKRLRGLIELISDALAGVRSTATPMGDVDAQVRAECLKLLVTPLGLPSLLEKVRDMLIGRYRTMTLQLNKSRDELAALEAKRVHVVARYKLCFGIDSDTECIDDDEQGDGRATAASRKRASSSSSSSTSEEATTTTTTTTTSSARAKRRRTSTNNFGLNKSSAHPTIAPAQLQRQHLIATSLHRERLARDKQMRQLSDEALKYVDDDRKFRSMLRRSSASYNTHVDNCVVAHLQDECLCPLSGRVMRAPVKFNGVVYEQCAIEVWLTTHDRCPSTGELLAGDPEFVADEELRVKIAVLLSAVAVE